VAGKWRPTNLNAIYTIADIHGNYELLVKLLNRILPLRKSDGGKDQLIFLGDYIDRHYDSPKVIDLLIQIKNEYPEQVVTLKGNHEYLLLNALGYEGTDILKKMGNFRCWTENGADHTIRGYLYQKVIMDLLPENLTETQIKELIPQSHIDFFQSCLNYYQFDNFTFVHGGYNPFIPLAEHMPEVFYWDRKLFGYVRDNIRANKSLGWEPQVIVCGHSGPNILVHDNYLMLDSGAPHSLMLTELHSRQALKIEAGKKRAVAMELENTKLPKAFFTKA
jgi:serine/threonine protein phosphatase 1